VIPGNDDAIRSIRLVTGKISEAIIEVRPMDEEIAEGTGVAATTEEEDDGVMLPVDEEFLTAFGVKQEEAEEPVKVKQAVVEEAPAEVSEAPAEPAAEPAESAAETN